MTRRIVYLAAFVLLLGCKSDEEKAQGQALRDLVVWDKQRTLDSVTREAGALSPGPAQDRLIARIDSMAKELAAAKRDAAR